MLLVGGYVFCVWMAQTLHGRLCHPLPFYLPKKSIWKFGPYFGLLRTTIGLMRPICWPTTALCCPLVCAPLCRYYKYGAATWPTTTTLGCYHDHHHCPLSHLRMYAHCPLPATISELHGMQARVQQADSAGIAVSQSPYRRA